MSDPKKRRVESDEGSAVMEIADLLTVVNVVCREHPRVHALGHVTKAIDELVDDWTLLKAVKGGSVHLAARMMRKIGESETKVDEEKRKQYRKAVGYAAAMGNLAMVQKLRQWSTIPMSQEVAVTAALNGNLPLLQWLKDEADVSFHRNNLWAEDVAFDVAAQRGCLETVQWLVTAFPDMVWTLSPAARGGHLKMVKWLDQHANLDVANLPGRIELLDHLHFSVPYSYIEACNTSPDKLFEGVQLRFREAFHESRASGPTDAMDLAARNGHLDVLQWLHEHRPEGCSAAAINSAAKTGNMEILLWLDSHCSEQWTEEAMDYASLGGHLSVVQWMHTNRSEGCSRHAMDWAAKQGHFDVVKWLHSNRSEGCSVSAMNWAAKEGHLDVVQWLHENRSEGCTVKAMDWAAERGHLDVVQWLHTNREEGCTTAAVDMAAGYGYLEVVKWLYANRTEGGTLMAIDFAERGGHQDVLQWFEEQNIDLPIPGHVQEDDDNEEEGA